MFSLRWQDYCRESIGTIFMANRRCINCKMIISPRFQMMKPTAKSLYSALIACADDDGVVEAQGVLMLTGTRKTALQELIDFGYVAMLDRKFCIVWIVGWQSFNTIDARYGTASCYRDTLKAHFPNIELLDLKAFDGYLPVGNTRIREEKKKEVSSREYRVQPKVKPKNEDYDDFDPYGDAPFK